MPSSLPSRLVQAPNSSLAGADDCRAAILTANDLAHESQRRELMADPGVHVVDTYSTQLDGLLRARNPRRKLTPAELAEAREQHLAGRSLETAGVWVYYPWRRSLVHLLNEAEFVELRTSRNRHKITHDEQRFLSQRRVGIIGLSVGAHVAMVLALERSCGELRLADFDVLELSNLNRLHEGVVSLGVKKTTLAARRIAEMDPFLKVSCFHEGLSAANLDDFFRGGGDLDLLVEECDDFALKVSCRERARELGIPVVMEANDRATLDIERFDRDPGRPILHGLLAGLDTRRVSELQSNEEKVPYLLPMVGEATMSNKLRASLLEIGESIEAWPQLASDVALGAGLVANVVRRIALDQLTDSGRYFVDLEELVQDAPRAVQEPGGPASKRPRRSREPAAAPLAEDAEAGQLWLDPRTLDALVEAALRAPSGANEQPWTWCVRGPNLWLVGRARFGESLLNYGDIATQLAVGAATENLVLRAHQLGFSVKLERNVEHAAVVGFRFFGGSERPRGAESHAYDALASAIEARHTNRRRTAGGTLASDALAALSAVAASVPRCKLQFVSDRPALAEVADVAARAERIRMLHPAGHDDMVREIRWTLEEAEATRDGIDLRTLDLSATELCGLKLLRSPGVPALLKRWRGGRGLEKLTKSSLLASSAVGLLTTSQQTAQGRVDAGRALERIWLSATELGISLQPHTAAVLLFARAFGGGARDFDAETLGELHGLHARLRAVFGASGGEVFLFRLFPGCEPLARSLRREAETDQPRTTEA
ncbi:MAG TPA: Rv1355c family protein [Polyangiaceae bacterium]